MFINVDVYSLVIKNASAGLPSRPHIIANSVRLYDWDVFKFAWTVRHHDDVYHTQYTAWYRPKP